MIEARDLTKIYAGKAAVDHLTFTVEPGQVTGFLGPNGAGKSTTMRLILGLDRPQSGIALINGRRYRDLKDPLRTVGALLEAKTVHPGRTARNHLLFLAQTQGLPARRVEQVLALVGLQDVADKRAGGFSLGMSQRLGVAVAMLGDPERLADPRCLQAGDREQPGAVLRADLRTAPHRRGRPSRPPPRSSRPSGPRRGYAPGPTCPCCGR